MNKKENFFWMSSTFITSLFPFFFNGSDCIDWLNDLSWAGDDMRCWFWVASLEFSGESNWLNESDWMHDWSWTGDDVRCSFWVASLELSGVTKLFSSSVAVITSLGKSKRPPKREEAPEELEGAKSLK